MRLAVHVVCLVAVSIVQFLLFLLRGKISEKIYALL
jgi:hypothetical protein